MNWNNTLDTSDEQLNKFILDKGVMNLQRMENLHLI